MCIFAVWWDGEGASEPSSREHAMGRRFWVPAEHGPSPIPEGRFAGIKGVWNAPSEGSRGSVFHQGCSGDLIGSVTISSVSAGEPRMRQSRGSR